MKVVAASRIYSSTRKNAKALVRILAGRHRRYGRVGEYESRFAEAEGSAFAIATSMARIGLWQVLRTIGLRQGDKILLSPVNIPEMLAVIENLGLEPVFVDFADDSLFVDPRDLERKAAGAKAFFLTYLAGNVGELASVREICERHGLSFIQDATQANRCLYRGRPLSAWADFTLFSTCELKFVHTYRGAMICLNSPAWHSRLRERLFETRAAQSTPYLLHKWLLDTAASMVLSPRWLNLVFHRFQDRIFTQDPLGDFAAGDDGRFAAPRFFAGDYRRMRERIPERMFFRASDFESELGLEALSESSRMIERHREIASRFLERLPESARPKLDSAAEISYWRFPLLFGDPVRAARFVSRLRADGIIAERSGLSLLSRPGGSTPNAERIIASTVFIPCHDALSDSDVSRIAERSARAIEAVA